jgi:phage gp36-like protein
MAYITQQQLVERFGDDKLIQLTDRDTGASIVTDVLDDAIADAAAFIDAYISPRYALPLAQPRIDASPLPRIAGDMVIYFLQGDLATEETQRRAAEARRFLLDVQAGRASLGADDSVAPQVGTVVVRSDSSAFDWSKY